MKEPSKNESKQIDIGTNLHIVCPHDSDNVINASICANESIVITDIYDLRFGLWFLIETFDYLKNILLSLPLTLKFRKKGEV